VSHLVSARCIQGKILQAKALPSVVAASRDVLEEEEEEEEEEEQCCALTERREVSAALCVWGCD